MVAKVLSRRIITCCQSSLTSNIRAKCVILSKVIRIIESLQIEQLQNTLPQNTKHQNKQPSINNNDDRGDLMQTVEIKSFVDYISCLEQSYNRNYIFRGIHNLKHRLIPKIGRTPYMQQCKGDDSFLLDNLQDIESKAVYEFVKKAIPHVNLREASSWDQWTIAQHHGLPTRFLDWTENPMIAAYFATENATGDVAVYVTNREQFNIVTRTTDDVDRDVLSFADEDEVVLFIPDYIHPRISAQKGIFTVHKNPTIPLDETMINGRTCHVDQLIIKSENIGEFVKDLDWCGINRSFIYPGLDGLAYYIDLKSKGVI